MEETKIVYDHPTRRWVALRKFWFFFWTDKFYRIEWSNKEQKMVYKPFFIKHVNRNKVERILNDRKVHKSR